MKKIYEAPVAEKIEFSYEDQVVASGKVICNIISGSVSNSAGQTDTDISSTN